MKIIALLMWLPVPELFENTQIAQNFLQSGTFYYDLDGHIDYNHQFPLYDLLLTVLYFIFGDTQVPVIFAHIIFNGLLAYTVLLLLRRVVPSEHRRLWMEYVLLLGISLHPILLNYQFRTIHPLTLDVLCFNALLLMSLYWIKEKSTQKSWMLFLIIGLTALERVTLLTALLPALFLVIKNRTQIVSLFCISGASLMLFLGAWMIRNYQHTERLELTSGTWRYLWVGIQEDTEGSNTLIDGRSYYELLPEEIEKKWGSMTLEEQMSFYKNAYTMALKEQPMRIGAMWGIKLRNFFWISNQAGSTKSEHLREYLEYYRLAHRIVLLLALWGWWVGRWRTFRYVILAILGLGVLQSFFYVEFRHALPIEGVLWVFALIGIASLLRYGKPLDPMSETSVQSV